MYKSGLKYRKKKSKYGVTVKAIGYIAALVIIRQYEVSVIASVPGQQASFFSNSALLYQLRIFFIITSLCVIVPKGFYSKKTKEDIIKS